MPCELKSECEDYCGRCCMDFYKYKSGCFREKLEAPEGAAPSGQAGFDLLSAKICMTCKHWADENEREKQVKAYKANPKCMDKKDGWPCAGDCNNTVANGIELYIDGNTTANLEYDANFGCNNWESI